MSLENKWLRAAVLYFINLLIMFNIKKGEKINSHL